MSLRLRSLLFLLAPLAIAGCTALSEPTDQGARDRSQLAPAEVFGGGNWTQVAAGYQHTCALDTTGKAWCWGANQYGQLGVLTAGSCSEVGTCARRPLQVSGGLTFVSIAAGSTHSCGLTAAGAAWCWGGGNEGGNAGFLGNGTILKSFAPVKVLSDSAFKQISIGLHNTCALTNAGQAWCWGRNARGELGDSSLTPRAAPVLVRGTSRYSKISLGIEHTCALVISGSAQCWGHNRFGQLGSGNVLYNSFGLVQTIPVRVQGTVSFVDISSGGEHTCALRTDGVVDCWGINASAGQLGDRSPLTHRGLPGPILDTLKYTTLSSGTSTTCGRAENGATRCWGGNFYGALGNGDRSVVPEPSPVASLGSGYTSFSGGGLHMCAINTEQRLFCWGDKKFGQIGN
jgi:alpha-tubulin suppressor-like RCC1 family protein